MNDIFIHYTSKKYNILPMLYSIIKFVIRDTPKTKLTVKCVKDILVKSDVKTDLTVNLNSEICTFSSIVGNKAKSLFQLKKAIEDGLINDVSHTNV